MPVGQVTLQLVTQRSRVHVRGTGVGEDVAGEIGRIGQCPACAVLVH